MNPITTNNSLIIHVLDGPEGMRDDISAKCGCQIKGENGVLSFF
jgi:hypothetical protein